MMDIELTRAERTLIGGGHSASKASRAARSSKRTSRHGRRRSSGLRPPDGSWGGAVRSSAQSPSDFVT
jgi:hypothetical protein